MVRFLILSSERPKSDSLIKELRMDLITEKSMKKEKIKRVKFRQFYDQHTVTTLGQGRASWDWFRTLKKYI